MNNIGAEQQHFAQKELKYNLFLRDFCSTSDLSELSEYQLDRLHDCLEDSLRDRGFLVDDEYSLEGEYLIISSTWDDYQGSGVDDEYSQEAHENYVLLHNYETLKGFIEDNRANNQT